MILAFAVLHAIPRIAVVSTSHVGKKGSMRLALVMPAAAGPAAPAQARAIALLPALDA